MQPSSRTPEGDDNTCSICGKEVRIEPSRPPGDAACPHCGALIWFDNNQAAESIDSNRILAESQLKLAVEAYNVEQYRVAETKLKRVLLLDPACSKARDLLEKVQQKLLEDSPGTRRRRRQRPAIG